MKKLCFFSLLLLGSLATGFAQGYVHFENASTSSRYFDDGVDRLVHFDPTAGAFNPFGTNYAPVVSNLVPSLRAQLYYGVTTSSESQLIPVTNAPTAFRSSTSIHAGAWRDVQAYVDVPSLGQYPYDYILANFQVRVWDISQAPTYEAAITDPGYHGLIGESAMFTQKYAYDPFDTGLTELRGFTVGLAPEPSSLGLTGLSVVSLLLSMRRRKDGQC